MRGIKIFLVVILFAGFFIFIKNFVFASGVVINEFVSNPEVGNEWAEIFNNSDEIIDLDGYKIFDNTGNSGKTVNQIISAFGWVVVDWNTSYLNNTGDSVILKNSSNEIVDQIDYGGAFSPGKGFSLARLIDGVGDWGITASPTPGFANFFPGNSESTENTESTSTTVVDWDKLKINELVSNPAEGNEWVEFYNFSSSSIDLSGALLCDNRETTGCLSLSGIALSNNWLYFDLGTKSFLNNGGDSVILKNSNQEVVDRVDYDELIPDKGQSLIRKNDGVDSDSLSDWAVSTCLTPGEINIICEPASSSNSSNNKVKEEQKNEESFFDSTSTYFGQIIFNEAYPYPGSSDEVGEFIEIKNLGNYAISLAGWSLVVGDKSVSLNDIIFINEIKIFEADKNDFSLNNSGGEIFLYDSGGYLVDNLKYGKLKSGISFSRKDSDAWFETSVATPGKENEFFSESGISVLWRLVSPDSVSVEELAEFYVGDSLDPRGGKIFFSWLIKDKIYSGEKLSLVFNEPGDYKIKIIATSTAGTYDEKDFILSVGTGLSENDFGVGLSEICPNPLTSQDGEFIELYNYALAETDISGWGIRYLGNEYIFPEGTIIKPGAYLSFFRPVSKLSLDNLEGKIDLLDSDLNVLDRVEYKTEAKGECFILYNNQWLSSVSSTPGQKNILSKKEQVETLVKKILASKKTTGSSGSVAGIKVFSLSGVRDLSKGTLVKISGIVSVLPGIFGTQFFYIFDGYFGMQVYQNKKLFPDLRVGDEIEVYGEVSESSGRKRVNVKSLDGFDILSVEKKFEPVLVTSENLNDEMFGSLVKIKGEITELKSSIAYLDDGQGEVVIYFKPGAEINKKDFKEGMTVEVTGVYENSSTGGQIWPRNSGDLKIIFNNSEPEEVYEMVLDDFDKNPVKQYVYIFVGGFLAAILGFWLRKNLEKIKTIFNK